MVDNAKWKKNLFPNAHQRTCCCDAADDNNEFDDEAAEAAELDRYNYIKKTHKALIVKKFKIWAENPKCVKVVSVFQQNSFFKKSRCFLNFFEKCFENILRN